jgi:signal transduction histidine kinase
VANRLAQRINSEAFRVNRIIEDLLDLSRIESEGSPSREPVPVSLFVADAIERIRTAAEQHRVTLGLRREREQLRHRRRSSPIGVRRARLARERRRVLARRRIGKREH